MNVPPEMPCRITSTIALLETIDIPIAIPRGAMIEKIPRKMMISFVVYPVLAKAAPRDTAAADLWIMIPAASYQADSTEVYRPKAMPSKREWAPKARIRTMAEALLTVVLVSVVLSL